jgi:hypothetical protein
MGSRRPNAARVRSNPRRDRSIAPRRRVTASQTHLDIDRAEGRRLPRRRKALISKCIDVKLTRIDPKRPSPDRPGQAARLAPCMEFGHNWVRPIPRRVRCVQCSLSSHLKPRSVDVKPRSVDVSVAMRRSLGRYRPRLGRNRPTSSRSRSMSRSTPTDPSVRIGEQAGAVRTLVREPFDRENRRENRGHSFGCDL